MFWRGSTGICRCCFLLSGTQMEPKWNPKTVKPANIHGFAARWSGGAFSFLFFAFFRSKAAEKHFAAFAAALRRARTKRRARGGRTRAAKLRGSPADRRRWQQKGWPRRRSQQRAEFAPRSRSAAAWTHFCGEPQREPAPAGAEHPATPAQRAEQTPRQAQSHQPRCTAQRPAERPPWTRPCQPFTAPAGAEHPARRSAPYPARPQARPA